MKFEPSYLEKTDGEYCHTTGKHNERWLILWYQNPQPKPGWTINLEAWTIDRDDGEGPQEITPDDWKNCEFAYHGSRTKAISKARKIKQQHKNDLIHGVVWLVPQIGEPISGFIGVYEWSINQDWDELEI